MSAEQGYNRAQVFGTDLYFAHGARMVASIASKSSKHFQHDHAHMKWLAPTFLSLSEQSLVYAGDSSLHGDMQTVMKQALKCMEHLDPVILKKTLSEHLVPHVGKTMDLREFSMQLNTDLLCRLACRYEISKSDLTTLVKFGLETITFGHTESSSNSVGVAYRVVSEALRMAPKGSYGASIRNSSLSPSQKQQNLNTVLLNQAPASLAFWTLGYIAHLHLAERCRADPVFLEMCVKEALRSHASVTVLNSRRAMVQQSVDCGSDGATVDLAAGATVILSPFLTMTSSEVWDDSSRFWPERWEEETHIFVKGGRVAPANVGTSRCPVASFWPFGFGRHMCPARTVSVDMVIQIISGILTKCTPVVLSGREIFDANPREALGNSMLDNFPDLHVELFCKPLDQQEP